MKILLEYPFNTVWERGYLVTNAENRRHVVLYNSCKDRSTISYSRYLVSVREGKFLSDLVEVDHVDNDKTNDCIDNLQILTKAEHRKKENDRRRKKKVLIRCPACSVEFSIRVGNSQLCKSKRGKVTCCSKKCSADVLRLKLDKEARFSLSLSSVIREFRE